MYLRSLSIAALFGFGFVLGDLLPGYREGLNVSETKICPTNESEWRIASDRMHCNSVTEKNPPLNHYYCLPNQDNSKLVEFCYDRNSLNTEKGNCWQLAGQGYLNQVNCSRFVSGCPNQTYLSEEIYKYQDCLRLNVIDRCYIAEKNCLSEESSTVVPFISTTEDVVSMDNISTTSKPSGTEEEGDKANVAAIIVPLCVILLIFGVVAFILCHRYRQCAHSKENSDEEERIPLNDERMESDLPKEIVLILRQTEDDCFTITTTVPLNISPNTDVKWKKNGKNISRKDERYACNAGEVLQLKLQRFDVQDEGRYWCVLSTKSRRVESNHISVESDEFFERPCLKNALFCCMLLQSEYQVRLHENVSIRDAFKTFSILKIEHIPSQETLKLLALSEEGVLSVKNDVINFVSKEEQTQAIQTYCSWPGFIEIFIRHASLENVKGYCQQHMKKTEMETVMERLGYDFLLHCPLHDKSLFALITRKLKIPKEILQMGKNDRCNFVRDLKTGGVQVFHGQGTVVGWARAGKTTLIKKLKQESDLKTTQTKTLEIHQNVFKVDVDGENLEICLAPEMMGPALNISIYSLKSENDLKESRKKHLIKDSDTKAVDENSEISPKDKESNSHFENTATGTSSIPSRQISNKYPVSDIPPKLVPASSSNDESSLSANPSRDNGRLHQELKFKKMPLTIQNKLLKIVTILDFGGQSSYYACHSVYFSPRAFHILVIDMSKDLHSRAADACETPGLVYSEWKYLDYIRYWITSIHMFSSSEAPVILVVSHTENISQQEEKQKMSQLYEIVISALPDVLRKHLNRERVFAVAKSSNKNLDNIKKSIVRILKDQDHWGRTIPTSWLRLETVLRSMRYSNRVIGVSLLWEIIKNESSIGITSQEDLLSALKFFHEIGIVLFSNDFEDNFVILNVQWFIDAFQCIIDPECPARYDDWRDKWVDFNRTGILEEDLLRSMWRTPQAYIEHQAQILDHMKRLGMLAKIGKKRWYIPFINKQRFEETSELQECDLSSTLCFVFEFFPVVVFYHLISFCINSLRWKIWIKGGSECVYHRAIILEHTSNPSHKILMNYFDKNTTKICGKIWQYSIELNVLVLKDSPIKSMLATEIRDIVQRFMESVKSESTNYIMDFHVGYRCRKGIKVKSSIILEEKFQNSEGELECPDCKRGAHIINFQETYLFWNEKKTEVSIYRRSADAGTDVIDYSPKQLKVIEIEGVDDIHHIACDSMQRIWFSVADCVLQINYDGEVLQRVRKKDTYITGIAVNREGCLLFTDDTELALFKVADGMGIKLRETGEWIPRSVHSSRYTGDIFIGLTRTLENGLEAKVIRYSETGEKVLQEIQWNDGKPLYQWPHNIAENEAGDIYASDYHAKLVRVVNKSGKFKMDLEVKDFWPHGVIIDRLGNVLVCNASHRASSSGVLVFNHKGDFLKRILTSEENILSVRQICVDDEDKLYLVQKNAHGIKVFQ